MGGDFGPKATVEGVKMASRIYPNVRFKLFGDQNISEPELKKSGHNLRGLLNDLKRRPEDAAEELGYKLVDHRLELYGVPDKAKK